MPESKNMSRVLYREWYPQIMYNHHQTGPDGAVRKILRPRNGRQVF